MKRKFLKSLCILAIVSLGITPLMAESNINYMTKELSKDEVDKEENLLTVEVAIKRAIEGDNTLVKYKRELKSHEDEIEKMNNYSSQKYLSKKIDIAEMNQKIEFQKDKIAKNVTDKYQSIILMEKNLELLKKQNELNENRVKQASLQKSKGYIDEVTYNKAVTTLENSRISEVQLQRNLTDIKNGFNNLTSCTVDEYTLYVPTTYIPFEVENTINSYAQSKALIMTDFSRQRVELMQDKYWDNFILGPTSSYDDYINGKAELDSSMDMIENTYNNYVLMIESQYTNLQKQVDTINTKGKDIQTILKDQKILEIRYKNGYISKMEYDTQKMALLSKEIEYISEIYRYNITKMQIEKPWVMN